MAKKAVKKATKKVAKKVMKKSVQPVARKPRKPTKVKLSMTALTKQLKVVIAQNSNLRDENYNLNDKVYNVERESQKVRDDRNNLKERADDLRSDLSRYMTLTDRLTDENRWLRSQLTLSNVETDKIRIITTTPETVCGSNEKRVNGEYNPMRDLFKRDFPF